MFGQSYRAVATFVCSLGWKNPSWKVDWLFQHLERTRSSVSRVRLNPTNDTAERLTGSVYEILTKTMRGFKSQDKTLVCSCLGQFFRGPITAAISNRSPCQHCCRAPRPT